MVRRGVYTLLGCVGIVCVTGTRASAQVTLAWDGDGRGTADGYALIVDGTRNDLGTAAFSAAGTCACTAPLPLSGGRHTVVVVSYNALGESPSAPFVIEPAANAGGPYAGQIGWGVVVSAAASFAPTGNLVRYTWRWGDGSADTAVTSSTATHAYTTAGTFPITLTVTDNAGATASTSTSVTVTTTSSLPAPWLTTDIGGVGLTGRATSAAGTFTVAGAGADIWGAADAFRYVYQPLNGDGRLVARVTSLGNTNAFAKAGVMIRESLNADSADVLLNIKPDGGEELLVRSATGMSTVYLSGDVQTPPSWLSLSRNGSQVVASTSSDGQTWRIVGSTPFAAAADVWVGLAVTSHNSSALTTATFDSVAMSTATSPLPGPSSTGDIVIRASDIASSSLHGTWRTAADPLSPGGIKLSTPDNGVSNTTTALASPADYVDVNFSAAGGRPYRVWLRLRATANSKWNDSVWVQYSDAQDGGAPAAPLNTTTGVIVNLATDATATSLSGWGWQDGAYWLSQPTVVTFAADGVHTMRIQVREDGVELDQIVLSPATYFKRPPGSASNDVTIAP